MDPEAVPRNFHFRLKFNPGQASPTTSPCSLPVVNRQLHKRTSNPPRDSHYAVPHPPGAATAQQATLLRQVRTLSRNLPALAVASSQLTRFRRRTFTTLSPLRPSLTPLRRPSAFTSFTPAPTPATSTGAAIADVVPTGAVSSHPSLAGALQMRFDPRNTMNGHTRLVQKRRHGFLYRMKTKTGRRILLRRRLKGRRNVAW